MLVKRWTDVFAVGAWRLDKEPATNDISKAARIGEHNVTKLLLGSKLIEGGLSKVLDSDLVE